jgi:hypothetical protein
MAEPNGVPDAIAPIQIHLANYKRLVRWLLGVALFPPIVRLTFRVAPPWPHWTSAIAFSIVASWTVLLVTYALGHNIAQSRLKLHIGVWALAIFVLFLSFAALNAFFVVDAPDNAHQVAKGFYLKQKWQNILNLEKLPDGTIPPRSEREILAGNEWDAYALYPEWTVNLVNLGLLTTWVLSFASLGGLTSDFLLLQEKKAVSTPRPK